MTEMTSNLSDNAKDLELSPIDETLPVSSLIDKQRTEDTLKAQTLPPLIGFYIYINIILIVLVFAFGAFENYLHWQNNFISDHVIIALISGVTVQIAAVLIAAYKGLFS